MSPDVLAPLRTSNAAMRGWERRYGNRLVISDVCVVFLTVAMAQIFRFGASPADLEIMSSGKHEFTLAYTAVSAIIAFVWLASLTIVDSRHPQVYGVGTSEYKRVVNATFFAFGSYAIVAYLLRAPIGRSYLLFALPVGLFLLLFTRWFWRKRLHRQRRRNHNQYRTLIVGEQNKCRHVAEELVRSTYAGFNLVGAISSSKYAELIPGVPVLGGYDGILEVVDAERLDTVVVTSSDEIDTVQLKTLSWELERRQVDLIVAASLTDVAGPRIHMRPVANMPLIHIDFPKFVGRKQFVKRMFDIVVSGVLIVLLSPLLLALTLIVKMTSRGPVLFKQERIGLGAAPFKMFKFRSMVVDAEERLAELQDLSEGNGVLFKMKNDPRVTPVGRVLRKFSLDELPQLFNVFGGSMSLVGPRPQLPKEVATYERWVRRRLLVKPGITGLWQVSGRSDLSWEDSVRLDLYYVENWSLAGDALLILRTIKTVLQPEGAY